jgi:LytS/YehU family sensor histidine kinase
MEVLFNHKHSFVFSCIFARIQIKIIVEKYSILYLDDETDNLIAFAAVFRRVYNVYTVQNTDQAFEVLSRQKIQIAVSDQRMPGTSGVEFLSQVSMKYPEIIRMILTGYSDIQAIIDAVNKGKIYYYITKPWKFDELKLIIENAINAYILKQKNEQLAVENQMLLLKTMHQEKEQLASQYEVLKNQVNPHFLFNSLNTLASLISSDPPMALRFTTKFAKMYRLILENGIHSLIPLSKEMELLNSYMFLQQMRYGNSLILHADITNEKFVLPPFALQLLAENAIKHNSITEAEPMVIEIIQKNATLVVKNKVKQRQSMESSTGIGLKNLSNRYKFLADMDIQIIDDGNYFTVNIPLIPEA